MSNSDNNPPSAPAYQQATSAYNTTQTTNASGLEIVVELYKGMIKNTEQAKLAYQQGKLDHMCELNKKTYKILIALQSNLDYEQGKDAADFLNDFYNRIFATLTKAIRKDDPVKEFNNVIEYIRPVYMRWNELAKSEKEAAQKEKEAVAP